MIDGIQDDLQKIRRIKPLILNITNDVSVEFVANVLLSLGAAPIVSTCEEEVEELVQMSRAININIGTLNHFSIPLFLKVAELANKFKKPLILDPVGAGATKIRTRVSKKLMTYTDVIKGNASEIFSLSHSTTLEHSKPLGVESSIKSENVLEQSHELARILESVVVVSGEKDILTNGKKDLVLNFGNSVMQHITGMGCALSGVIAAFCAVNNNYFKAAYNAVGYFTLCGSIIRESHPASFQSSFINEVFKGNVQLMQNFLLRK